MLKQTIATLESNNEHYQMNLFSSMWFNRTEFWQFKAFSFIVWIGLTFKSVELQKRIECTLVKFLWAYSASFYRSGYKTYIKREQIDEQFKGMVIRVFVFLNKLFSDLNGKHSTCSSELMSIYFYL